MKVILLKDWELPGGKVLPKGRNVHTNLSKGYELIGKRKAGQIPEYAQGDFFMNGELSTKMLTLRRTPEQPPVTIEEYEKFTKIIVKKERKENAS